jgi:hypothetical protein
VLVTSTCFDVSYSSSGSPVPLRLNLCQNALHAPFIRILRVDILGSHGGGRPKLQVSSRVWRLGE